MNVLDSGYWGVEANLPWGNSAWTNTWQDRAEDVGVGLARVPLQWHFIERDSGTYDFSELDSFYEHRPNGSCEALAYAITCPRWAATAMESTEAGWDTSKYGPPLGLYEPVDSSTNYFARFLRALLAHVDEKEYPLHLIEVGNERVCTVISPIA